MAAWILMTWLMTDAWPARPGVTVCVTTPGLTLTGGALALARTTLEQAGVAVEWQCVPPHRRGGAARPWLPVALVEGAPEGDHPGVLAVSYPYARCSKGITVFVDRVRPLARGQNEETALLAYVVVHEITHVLQGVVRHSETGIMRARWDRRDLAAIAQHRLAFDRADVHLLRQGLAADWCGGPAAVTDRSGPGTAFRRE
jgi:hypothetical protein